MGDGELRRAPAVSAGGLAAEYANCFPQLPARLRFRGRVGSTGTSKSMAITKYSLLAAAILLSACKTVDPQFTAIQPIAGADPDRHIVVVYTHGSTTARTPDGCDMNTNDRPWGIPKIVAELEGQPVGSKTIRVHRFCTPSRTGEPLSSGNLSRSKVRNRTGDLLSLASEYRKAGFASGQIIFTGHSTGGYASLLAQRDNSDTVAKVIAFGPAFAGKRTSRSPGESSAHNLFKEQIADAPNMNALVYVYEGDVYNRLEDLQIWKSNSGIEMIAFYGREIDGVACGIPYAHHRVFDGCFRETQTQKLLEFISR